MLYTVRGMWHSTQELPVLPVAWRVCAVIASPIAVWQRVQRAFAVGRSCGFFSIYT
jgi:hypothetical protein